MTPICPIHKIEMREFTAGPKAKNPGMKYHKCTQKTDGKFCEQVRFPEDTQFTKKFTQTPDGVVETEERWPTEAPVSPQNAPERTQPSLVDIQDSLSRIHVKLNKLLKETDAQEN